MSRQDIYYWKCDRPAAFHGTRQKAPADGALVALLEQALQEHFASRAVALAPAQSQGNHLTWTAEINAQKMFVRVENGPEGDSQLEVESAILGHLQRLGLPVPHVFGVDATRSRLPFAWQALSLLPWQDLNAVLQGGLLNAPQIAFAIGSAIAHWQGLNVQNFGPFDIRQLRGADALCGYHPDYPTYYRLRLDEHLSFLVGSKFLTPESREQIACCIQNHSALLEITDGCFVHKDLALWNILGDGERIGAFIDFDDSISGDPMDDLSLLGCFHDGSFLTAAFAGYQSVRPLPPNYRRRFWLHLLRNMIVKAVIRVGAGYFERSADFFLIGAGNSGTSLRRFTEQRLALALEGLHTDAPVSIL